MKFCVAKNNDSRGASLSIVTKPVSKPKQGRERLQHFAEQIGSAHNAIEDLEGRVARFEAIIAESKAAERSLQDAINSDGGVALASYSSGQTKPTDEINRLVAHAKSSGEAAGAAKVAKPHTEALLENARSQLVSLNEQKNEELNRVVANLADVDARAYQKAFDEMCVLHDRLVGYANTAQSNIGSIQLIIDPLRAPRFALPSMGNSDADPFLRHNTVNDLTVGASARKWAQIRSRLEADVDAYLDDLLI
jgi:hypothetical protein